MVGRKTSGRCENCRKRKTKCDLALPECSQCLRRNVKCPGYDIHGRFHTVYPTKFNAEHRKLPPATSLVSSTDRLRNEYISSLNHDRLAVRFWLTANQRGGDQSTLNLIAQRIGESEALDAAVKCVSRPPLPGTNMDVTRRSYMKALGSLQDALDDKIESLNSGTLAAATLLYMYEIFLHPFEQGWTVHAEGIVKLLHVRGPGRIQTDLDRSIVAGQVGSIFLHAVRNCRPCFLANPEWNVLLRQLTTKAPHAGRYVDEPSSALSLIVSLPGLLCRYEDLSIANDAIATNILISDIHNLRQQLQHWRECDDTETTQQNSNADLSKALEAPVQFALRMTNLIFLVLTGYMLANLVCRNDSTDTSILHEQNVLSDTEFLHLLEESSKFAQSAETRWLAMNHKDTVAGWAFSTPIIIMLRRALKVPCVNEAELHRLRTVVENLYKFLGEND